MSASRFDHVLPDILDFAYSVDFVELLRSNRHSEVRLDGGCVTHLGASFVQVLLSASRTWSGDGITFVVETPSSLFLLGLDRLGITGFGFVVSEVDL